MIHRDNNSPLGNDNKSFSHIGEPLSKNESRPRSAGNSVVYVEMRNPLREPVGRIHSRSFSEELSNSIRSPQKGNVEQVKSPLTDQVRIFPDKIQSGDRVILHKNRVKNSSIKGKLVKKPEKPKPEQPVVFKKNWQHRKLPNKVNDEPVSNIQIHKSIQKQFSEGMTQSKYTGNDYFHRRDDTISNVVMHKSHYVDMKYSPTKQRDISRSSGEYHENNYENISILLSNKNSEECNSNQGDLIYEIYDSDEYNEPEVFSPQISKDIPTSTKREDRTNTLPYLPISPIHKSLQIPSFQKCHSNRGEYVYTQQDISCNNTAKPKRHAPPIPILTSSSNRNRQVINAFSYHAGEIKRKY